MNVVKCASCDRALRPNQPYTYREITALEQVARTGGVGSVRGKQYTGRTFCPDCGGANPALGLFDQEDPS